MSDSSPDPLLPLIKRWLQSDDPDSVLGQLCREHPQHADALRVQASDIDRIDGDAARPLSADTATSQKSLAASQMIGPFCILDTLGEGGMGTVYLAQQIQPVRRKVAIKVVKLGMGSKEIIRRFEQERQALALMDHEGIAKVFDCGTTDQGQPYIVMELVKGLPLDVFCKNGRLSLVDRLNLMMQVCAAVQHAHQKGVVHRDLKPGNVLVSNNSGRLQIKIIDFGLAKAMGQDLIEATLHTEVGRVMGTPEYMAPEQADPSNADVDTRADVYSLGVMLYQMLVGELPFSGKELRKAGIVEMQRVLREVEPPKPSYKLTTLGSEPSQHANDLRVSVGSLKKALKGDLDWVVVKALEKDRNRRYESANALSEDLQRFLDHEPLVAGPPSAAYRLRKLSRRYRLQLATIGLVVLSSLTFGSVAYFQWRNAAKASEAKSAALKREIEAKNIAASLAVSERQAKEDARANAARLKVKVAEFDQLSGVVRCEELAAIGASFLGQPAWPSSVLPMEMWIGECEALLAMRADVGATLQDLRRSARRSDETAREQFRLNAPEQYVNGQQGFLLLSALRQAQAVRDGGSPPDAALTSQQQALGAAALSKLALARAASSPASRDVWGEEPIGLAAARLAVAKSEGDADRGQYLATLAQALVANGLDAEALRVIAEAVALAPPDQRERYTRERAAIESAIGEASRRLASAEAAYGGFGLEFDDQAVFFLHRVLRELAANLDRLRDEQRPEIEARVDWAHWVESLTLAHPNASVTWRAVRDGVAASKLYTGCEVPLSDEDVRTRWLGLVPMGANPQTGLYEFYHLKSALSPLKADWDGVTDPFNIEIPVHRSDGSIEVTEQTGIVFVLLPGGVAELAAGRKVYGKKNEPARVVDLTPFLIARHELTKSQWARLWCGAEEFVWPSLYAVGASAGLGAKVTAANPVEQVNWKMCRELLTAHGLKLPTEAQWEYACRAGTSTPWFVEKSELQRYENLADQSVKRVGAPNMCESWDDGFVIHAPVGSFAANGFGLHDTVGNVSEWCLDEFTDYGSERPGDGLRPSVGSRKFVARGANWSQIAVRGRSANRGGNAPQVRVGGLGCRAVRLLDVR